VSPPSLNNALFPCNPSFGLLSENDPKKQRISLKWGPALATSCTMSSRHRMPYFPNACQNEEM